MAAKSGVLALLPGREAKLHVSFYTDDAVIFANPVRDEIDFLLNFLNSFGDSMGLCVNPSKSSVAHIRCDAIEVLRNSHGQRDGFPLNYLGLPITIKGIRHVHLQFILYRISELAWLAGEEGCWCRVLVRNGA